MSSSSKDPLNAISDEAIRKFQVTDVPIRLDPRLCAIDPYNRDETLMSGKKVHELLWKIMRSGFSLFKVSVGFVVDLPAYRLEAVRTHNKAISSGDPLLADIPDEEVPVFTVIHTNHFVQIHRCFVFQTPTIAKNQELGITTPDGRLSLHLLAQRSPAFHDYLEAGHRAIRLRAEILQHPALVKSIITSCNHDLAMGETEMQLMVVIRALLHPKDGPSKEAKDVLDDSSLEDLNIRFPHLRHHIKPFVSFVAQFGTQSTGFIEDLDVYYTEHVQALGATSDATFWDQLSAFPPEFGWAAIAFAKDHFSWDKISGGICKGVPLNRLKILMKDRQKMRDLHGFLMSWRQQAGRFDTLSTKARSRVLAQLDMLSSRVTLHGKERMPSPGNAAEEIEISTLAHVAKVCDYFLQSEKARPQVTH